MIKNLLALLLVSLFFNAPSSVYASEAMDAFNKKDYNEAYRLWSRDPNKAESEYGVGRILLEGLGGPSDPTKGLNLLVKSANKKYMRAIRYLARYYEKNRNWKQAIRFLKKTGNPKNNLQLQTKILELTKKRGLKRPIWESKLYCTEATIFSQAGGKITEKDLMEKCAIANNKSIYTKNQALDSLVKSFTSEPTEEVSTILKTNKLSTESKALLIQSFSEKPTKSFYEIIVKVFDEKNPMSYESEIQLVKSFSKIPNEYSFNLLGKSLLDPKSKIFRPDLVENYFWVKQKNKQETIFLNSLREYNVSFKTCGNLPMGTELEKNKANSYCLLSGLIEKKSNVVEEIAQSYLYGTDGKNTDPEKAIYLMDTTGKSVANKNIQIVKLDSFRRLNNWQEHLNTLHKMRKQILIEQKSLEEHLKFQYEKLVLFPESGYKKNHGVQLAEVLIDIPTIPKVYRLEAYKKLMQLPDANKYAHPTADIDLKLKLKDLKDLAYGTDNISTVEKSSALSNENANTRKPGHFASKRRPVPTGEYVASYNENKTECDAGLYDSCAAAAAKIMSDAPPREYRNKRKKEREKIAIKLLEKGADAESDDALIMLYDIYRKKFNDPDLKEKRKEYLAILVAKQNPAGLLRKNIEDIPSDPISGLISGVGGILTGNAKKKNACKNIERLIESKRLTFEDETRALVTLDNCKNF